MPPPLPIALFPLIVLFSRTKPLLAIQIPPPSADVPLLPPCTPAVLPLTVLDSTCKEHKSSTAVLAMPPPLEAKLPLIVLLFTLKEASFRMPPPGPSAWPFRITIPLNSTPYLQKFTAGPRGMWEVGGTPLGAHFIM